MSQDNDVSIKATASADIAELVQYAQVLKDVTQALSDYADVATRATAAGAGGGGGGGGPAAPTGPASTNGTPPTPAAPAPPNTLPNPPVPPAAEPSGSDDDEMTPFQRNLRRGYGQANRSGVVHGAISGAMAGGVAGAIGGGIAASMSNQAQQGFGERWGGRIGGTLGLIGGPLGSWAGSKIGGMMGGLGDTAMGYAASAANQGATLALGSSPSGFFMASAQKYMELSKTISQMNARFRDVDGTVTRFGGALSYTIERTAAMAAALGEATDSFTTKTAQSYAGYSRARGLDPSQAMGSFGAMQSIQGGIGLSEGQLAQMDMASRAMGMNQGQHGQALSLIAAMAQQQLEATGRPDIGTAAAVSTLPRDIFQPGWRTSNVVDPRARGSMGQRFIGQVDTLLTSKTGAGASTMMRAMGYGPGDMTYREMRRRQEEGLANPENLTDLADYIGHRSMGLGGSKQQREDYTYRFLEAMGQETGANFKAHQLDALTDMFTDRERMDEYKTRRKSMGADEATKWLKEGLSDEEKKAFGEQGWLGLGKGKAGTGEGIETRIEGMMMRAGKPIAEAIPKLQNAIESVVKALDNLSTVDWGALLTKLVTAIEGGAKRAEEWSKPGGKMTLQTPMGEVTLSSDDVREAQRDPSKLTGQPGRVLGRTGRQQFNLVTGRNGLPDGEIPFTLNRDLYDGDTNTAGGGR